MCFHLAPPLKKQKTTMLESLPECPVKSLKDLCRQHLIKHKIHDGFDKIPVGLHQYLVEGMGKVSQYEAFHGYWAWHPNNLLMPTNYMFQLSNRITYEEPLDKCLYIITEEFDESGKRTFYEITRSEKDITETEYEHYKKYNKYLETKKNHLNVMYYIVLCH